MFLPRRVKDFIKGFSPLLSLGSLLQNFLNYLNSLALSGSLKVFPGGSGEAPEKILRQE